MGGFGSNMFGGNAKGFVGDERRIVLVGKTGVGKSAVGNTILGREAFESELSPTSLTTDCKKAEGSVDGRPVAVIDTPGLLDTNLTQEEAVKRIKSCISLSSPGPHAFLVVLQLGRFTQEEKETVKMIMETFGKEAAKYTMVLFTYGDRLKKDETIEGFLSESPDLKAFIQSCSGTYHVFNNKVKDLEQTSQLLDKIDRMTTANGGSYYTNDMFMRAEAAIEKKMERLLKEMEEEKQRELEELRGKLSEEDYLKAEAEVKQKYEDEARRSAEKSNDFLGKTIIGLTTGSGATTGAALGAFGGPVGALVGGAIGGVVGIVGGFITSAASKK